MLHVSGGAAKDITFEISDPIEDSSGYVISDLPHLKEGIPLLGSGERIRCLWDHIDRLMPSLREKGLHEGIAVKVKTKTLKEQLTQRSGESPQSASVTSLTFLVENVPSLSWGTTRFRVPTLVRNILGLWPLRCPVRPSRRS